MKPPSEFYSKELTENYEKEVKALLAGKGSFRILSGLVGTGKTSSVYRQANLKNCAIVKFDPTVNLEDRKEELKSIIMGFNERLTILLFDAIDKIWLPDWFFSRDKTNKNKNTFMAIAKRNYKQSNFVIIATTTKIWTLHPELKKIFVEVKTNLDRWIIKRHIKQECGVPAGNNFPIDLRKMHQYVRAKGDIDIDRPLNIWSKFRDFFSETPRYRIPDMSPPFADWVLANLLNNNPTGFPNKHNAEFYQMIATICLADQYDDEILKALPTEGYMRYMQIFRPQYRSD